MRSIPTLAERRVFIDTSAYYALAVPRDADHEAARTTLHHLANARYRMYTTNVLVIECHALLLARVGPARAGNFIRDMDAGNTTLIRVRALDEERAKAVLFRYTDKDFSFADAISFVVMERLGISRVFTFDDHFAQYGFTIASPQTIP